MTHDDESPKPPHPLTPNPLVAQRIDDDSRLHVVVGGLLRGALPAVDFRRGFADRAMARIASNTTASPLRSEMRSRAVQISPSMAQATALQHSFIYLAIAATVAIVALGTHNVVIARTEHTSLVEAAIGLQPVSTELFLSYSSDALQ